MIGYRPQLKVKTLMWFWEQIIPSNGFRPSILIRLGAVVKYQISLQRIVLHIVHVVYELIRYELIRYHVSVTFYSDIYVYVMLLSMA